MTARPATTPVGTSASEAFDRLLVEAIDISRRIGTELADGQFPPGLHWGVKGLTADRKALQAAAGAERTVIAAGWNARSWWCSCLP